MAETAAAAPPGLRAATRAVDSIAGPAGRALAAELEGVSFGYRGRLPVLRSVSLQVPEGQLVMVLGASGSGKTTLLKLMKGLLWPGGGVVRLFGEAGRSGRRRSRLDPGVAYIPQQLGLVRSRSVLDNALSGALGQVPTWRGVTGIYPAATVRDAHDALVRLGIGHKVGEKVRSLSGGERQRVAIARALVQRPRLLLADEFVSQLDPATTIEIMELVRDVVGQGVTTVMTTHELDVVEQFADRVVVLRDGEKVLDAPGGEVSKAALAGIIKQ